ncbi:MAG: hypothetical protein AAF385_10945 [Pseudomonadota bacterium]
MVFEQIDQYVAWVILQLLGDQSRIIVRPSGTEPKVKCYYEVIADMNEGQSLEKTQDIAAQRLQNLVEAHQSSIRPT